MKVIAATFPFAELKLVGGDRKTIEACMGFFAFFYNLLLCIMNICYSDAAGRVLGL